MKTGKLQYTDEVSNRDGSLQSREGGNPDCNMIDSDDIG